MKTPGSIHPARLGLALALYALQGVVVAYLVNFNKSYMVGGGVNEVVAGRVQTAVLLTLVFKFLLGPLSDRFNPFGLGHRRPFIVLGVLAQSVGLVGLSLFPPGTSLGSFVAMAFLAVIGLCLYDTCCDGMVVDATPPDDRTRVQGFMQVSRFLATMVFTWGFGQWLHRTGAGPGKSEGILWTCAAMGLPVLIFAAMLRDARPHGDRELFDWRAMRSLGRAKALLAFGALYGIIGVGVEFNLTRYYEHLGFDYSQIGQFDAVRYAGRAAGAACLPLFNAKLGRRGELIVALLGLSCATAGQMLVHGPTSATIWAFLVGVSYGWIDALFCVMAMDAADPRMAASTFAVFMAVSNLSVLGDSLFVEAVHLTQQAYRIVLGFAALLSVGLFAMIPALTRRTSKEALDDA